MILCPFLNSRSQSSSPLKLNRASHVGSLSQSASRMHVLTLRRASSACARCWALSGVCEGPVKRGSRLSFQCWYLSEALSRTPEAAPFTLPEKSDHFCPALSFQSPSSFCGWGLSLWVELLAEGGGAEDLEDASFEEDLLPSFEEDLVACFGGAEAGFSSSPPRYLTGEDSGSRHSSQNRKDHHCQITVQRNLCALPCCPGATQPPHTAHLSHISSAAACVAPRTAALPAALPASD